MHHMQYVDSAKQEDKLQVQLLLHFVHLSPKPIPLEPAFGVVSTMTDVA